MKALRAAWRWSWLATVPCLALFAVWLATTWQQWRAFVVEHDGGPQQGSLREVGAETLGNLWRRLRLRLQPHDLRSVPADLQLRSIQLFVADQDLAALDQDLPHSGFAFRDALLRYPEGLHEVKVRYRGDFPVHWAHAKKSWRIRTGTNDLFGGLRELNLIAPKTAGQLNNFLAYALAREFGLITPRCELVNVFVNGQNRGLHELTEQLDEGTLRAHDRMPGDLYSGELVGRDAFADLPNDLWEHAGLWTKVAANNHYPLESRAPLQRLLDLLRGADDEATHAALAALLDLDAFGRFAAFELLAQTRQFDDSHNWRLFWDPWRLKFEPVVWDPVGWPDDAPTALDLAPSRLHRRLLRNGVFLAARQRALARFFADGAAERFAALVQRSMAQATAALAYDPLQRPASSTAVAAAMQALQQRMVAIAMAVRIAHVATPSASRWQRLDAETVRLQVAGRMPVTAVQIRLDGAAPAQLAVPVLHPAASDVPATVVEATGVGDTLQLAIELPPGLQQVLGSDAGFRPAPACYDLVLPGLAAATAILGEATVTGGITLPAAPADDLETAPAAGLRQAWPPAPPREPLRWSGVVDIERTTRLAAAVAIEPGTTVRLGPGVSLIFGGKVTALGTRERPIRFVPRHPDQEPWGTLAWNGPGCSGSRLRHCEARGGSGHQEPLEEYCSMVSLHNCRDVVVEDCTFGDNHHYDDLVHAMYAEVLFDRVVLDGARADALDCDISTVVIRNSRFSRSGNDGVDLMTTRALVEDCRFEANGDKGISIGEGSQLLALRNRFVGCNKAMEAKDGSQAAVANCEIRACRKALNAYKKNWRYAAGGELSVHLSEVVGNDELPTADSWSLAELIDCQVQGTLAPTFEQEYVDGTTTTMANRARLIECSAEPQPARRERPPLPPGLTSLPESLRSAWTTVRTDRRGVPDGR